MSIRYLIVALFLVGFVTTYEINEKEVERIIKTLSSDEMQGRTINSQGINKAADFIAGEFLSIGLEEMDGAKYFKQKFNINSISISDAQVVINEMELGGNEFFIQLSVNSIAWGNGNLPEILYVKEGDNFRQKVGSVFGSKKNHLVVISKSHASTFGQYHAYFSRPKMSFDSEETEGGNIVFALSDVAEVENIDIKAGRSFEKTELSNVVAVLPGKRTDEIVLYSAHHDHLGIGESVDGDSIYNGANDDASGVTAVIELARYFKSKGRPERTLVFATFTAEEVGGYGSKFFSKKLDPDKIVAMLNIEMIGKTSKEGLNSAWMSGWDKSDLGLILQKNLEKVDFKFFADPYPKQNLFYRSDNATLARLGVPAHSISTTQIDIDTDYHQLSDEVSTLDITNITNTIKAIAIGSQGIVDGEFTPTRIDPEQVRD